MVIYHASNFPDCVYCVRPGNSEKKVASSFLLNPPTFYIPSSFTYLTLPSTFPLSTFHLHSTHLLTTFHLLSSYLLPTFFLPSTHLLPTFYPPSSYLPPTFFLPSTHLFPTFYPPFIFILPPSTILFY